MCMGEWNVRLALWACVYTVLETSTPLTDYTYILLFVIVLCLCFHCADACSLPPLPLPLDRLVFVVNFTRAFCHNIRLFVSLFTHCLLRIESISQCFAIALSVAVFSYLFNIDHHHRAICRMLNTRIKSNESIYEHRIAGLNIFHRSVDERSVVARTSYPLMTSHATANRRKSINISIGIIATTKWMETSQHSSYGIRVITPNDYYRHQFILRILIARLKIAINTHTHTQR